MASSYEKLEGYSGVPAPDDSDTGEGAPVNCSGKDGYETLPGCTDHDGGSAYHDGYEVLDGASVFDDSSGPHDRHEELQGLHVPDDTRPSVQENVKKSHKKKSRKSSSGKGRNGYTKLENSESAVSSEYALFAKSGAISKPGDYSCFDGKDEAQDELATVAMSAYLCTFQGILKLVEATLCLIAVLFVVNNKEWELSTTKMWFLFVNISAVIFTVLVLFVHWCRVVEKFPTIFQKLVLGLYIVYDILLLSAGFLSTIAASQFQRDNKTGWELIEAASVFTFFGLLVFIVDTPLQYKGWRLADLTGNLAGLGGGGTLYKGFTYHI